MSIGIALNSSWLASGKTISSALCEMRRVGVHWLQVHLVSLLTSSLRGALLHAAAHDGLRLVVHFESTDDMFSLPAELKASAAWHACVLHLPKGADAAMEVRWCHERLARRNVRLLIENDDARQPAGSFMAALEAMPKPGICFDVGHEMVAPTGLASRSGELLRRVELIHLHGVDLRTGNCHLDPWTRGAVDDDALAIIFAVMSYVPVVLEIRDLAPDNVAQTIDRVRARLAGLGWHPGAGNYGSDARHLRPRQYAG